MEQKQAGTQNECKDVTTGMWKEEGKRNSIRNAEGTSSSAGASEQKRRRPQQERSRNQAGLQQERNKHERGQIRKASAAENQKDCNKNATKTTGGAAGTQQEIIKNPAGL